MPQIKYVYSEKEIEEFFKNKGYDETVITYEQDDMCDGTVYLQSDLHIQVGAGYLILIKEEGYKMKTLITANHPADIYNYLKNKEK
jgi:hypothetical protein